MFAPYSRSPIPTRYHVALAILAAMGLAVVVLRPFVPPAPGRPRERPVVARDAGSTEAFQMWAPMTTGDGGKLACIGAEGPVVYRYQDGRHETARLTLCVQWFRDTGTEILLTTRPGSFRVGIDNTRIVHVVPLLGLGTDITVTLTPTHHGTSLRVTPVEPLIALFRGAIMVTFPSLPFLIEPANLSVSDGGVEFYVEPDDIPFYTHPLLWPVNLVATLDAGRRARVDSGPETDPYSR